MFKENPYTLLWTDLCIYFMSALVLAYAIKIILSDSTRQKAYVFLSKPTNMLSLGVLFVFLGTSLLDSIHFKDQANAGTIRSVLDLILSGFILPDEQSYSAPLSIFALSQSVVEQNGEFHQIYPRLIYGGAHLSAAEEHVSDLLAIVTAGLLKGAVIASALSIFLWQLLGQKKQLIAAKSLLFLVFIMALGGTVALAVSSKYHLLGTNKVGVDVFYESIKGIRTSLIFGTLTCVAILPFAVTLGISAGYFKGKIDDVIQYIYTTLSAIPSVLLIAAMVLILDIALTQNSTWFESNTARADARLLLLCLILGATSWTGLCRLLRGEVLKLSTLEYIQAAKCLGASHFRIIFTHLFLNVRHIILISLALDFSGFVLAEAVLSYVGVGVDPSTYSWGSMINGARVELSRSPVVWWSLAGSFIFMFLLVVSANMLADGLRDYLDPRLSKGRK